MEAASMIMMRPIKILIYFSLCLAVSACQPTDKQKNVAPPEADKPLKLWYESAANNWNEALPIGDGRLGAMIFGGTSSDTYQLNEDTIWAGGPNNNVNDAYAKQIPNINALLLANQNQEAQKLADSVIKSHNNGMPYQTIGNLVVNWPGHDQFSDYSRTLNLSNAVHQVAYTSNGVEYQRQSLAAFGSRAMVHHYTANAAESVNFDLAFNSEQPHQLTIKDQTLVISGSGEDHEGVAGQIRFTTLVKPVLNGGTVTVNDSGLSVRGASSATVYITTATNFKHFNDISADHQAIAWQDMRKASQTSFADLKHQHIKAYQRLFNRVSISLGSAIQSELPTDQRIEQFAQLQDPAMAELYFQYGRYLLISSSQPGTQPANLQGIWNRHTKPPWDSKYTVNINTEMNYWPAEVTNLSELHQPLFDMLEDLSQTGKQSARDIYQADGWMMHHNTDLWRITGEVDGPFWGQWISGGAWLAQHIGYRYAYTGDREFLARYYPVLKGAAEFYVSILQRDPDTGWLVALPSNSPENSYTKGPNEGGMNSIAAGTTIDNQLIFDLFNLVIDSSQLLDVDHDFASHLRGLRDQLPPMRIGQHGQLQEWLDDWDQPDDKHRHVSHLYGLHPSNQISAYRTPELFLAARKSLDDRGDQSTGWSMGWKINLWARLRDGDRAYKLLQDQISLVTEEGFSEAGGTYANLLDAHPPFQIDGNFGVTAGIAEMLMQSHDGMIDLLPALPARWADGEVKGLVARGGFVIDMKWRDHKPTYLKVHSTIGGELALRSPVALRGNALLTEQPEDYLTRNPLLQVPQIKPALINTSAVQKSPVLPDSKVYSFNSEAATRYEFYAKD